MAGRFTIEASFKAIDRISAPVSKMQNRVGKFTRSMSRGLRSVNRVMGKVAQGIKTGVMVGAAAAAGVVTGLAVAVRSLADSMDTLAKRTRRLEFPIEEFQEWRFVAEQSGATTEEFDKGIEDFAKRIGEARANTGAMVTMLKNANPELLKQLKNTNNTADALELYLDAIRKAPNAMDKAALANAGFGRAGKKLINITHNSAEAIKALRKEARENGLVTQDQAEAAEAFNDSINSLMKSLDGFRIAVLSPLLPQLTEIARKLRAWSVENRELISSKVMGFFTFLRDNFQEIVKWAKRVGVAIGIFFALAGVLKIVAGVLTIVNAVMAANPVGLIIIGVAALIGFIVLLVKKWDFLKEKFLSFPAPVKAAILILFGPLIALAALVKLIIDNWEPIKAFFVGVFEKISSIFNALPGPIKTAVAIIVGGPIGMLIKAVQLIIENWSTVTAFFAGFWDSLVNTFQTAWAAIRFVFDAVRFSAEEFVSIWQGVGGAIFTVWDGIVRTIQTAVEKIKPILAAVAAPLKAVVGGAAKLGGLIFGKKKKDRERDERDAPEGAPAVSGRALGREPQMVSPGAVAARQIEEKRETSEATLTVKAEPGTVTDLKQTKGRPNKAVRLQTAKSGAF